MRHALILLCVALAVLVGCDPPEVVFWNPKGDRAAVLGESGLYLAKGDGTISGVVAPGVSHAAWLSDGRQLAIVREQKIEKWSTLKDHLLADQRETIDRVADRIRTAIKGLADGGGMSALPDSAFSADATNHDAAAALLQLMETDKSLLMAKLSPEQLRQLQDHPPTVSVATVSLLDTQTDPPAPGHPLIQLIGDARVIPSPGGQGAVVARLDGAQAELHLVSFKPGTKPIRIAPFAGHRVAWSRDSLGVAFVALSGPSRGKSIGTLTTLALPADWADDPQKVLLQAPSDKEPSPMVAMTEMQYAPSSHLAWLNNGSIVFAAHDLSFPRPANTDPKHQRLFVVDPAHPTNLTTLLDDATDLADDDLAHLFEVNPAQTHVLVPGANGRVVLIDLKARTIAVAVAGWEGAQMAMQPVWRGDDEVCFGLSGGDSEPADVARPGDPRPGVVFLQRVLPRDAATDPRDVSRTWSNDALKGLHTKDRDNPAPPRGRAL